MVSCNTILHENRAYWTGRAPGYSRVNREELSTGQHRVWQEVLRAELAEHFAHRRPGEIRVLDVGTGPGFFAILLAECGYQVTGIDLTCAMLDEARKNAGSLAGNIRFAAMNAEALDFDNGSFDVVVTRNVTWNLPHPERAYTEWLRVLRPGGLLLNFDANWYSYLYDDAARAGYEADRRNTAQRGLKDANIGENFDVMEDIARRVPLSAAMRPRWDVEVLSRMGMTVSADEEIWRRVWSEEEKINFASTPMFLIRGHK